MARGSSARQPDANRGRGGRHVEDKILAHISSAHSELGQLVFDVDRDRAEEVDVPVRLSSGYRPLRERNSASTSILV